MQLCLKFPSTLDLSSTGFVFHKLYYIESCLWVMLLKSIKCLVLIVIIGNYCQGPPIKHGGVSHRDVDMPQRSSSPHITIKLCSGMMKGMKQH